MFVRWCVDVIALQRRASMPTLRNDVCVVYRGVCVYVQVYTSSYECKHTSAFASVRAGMHLCNTCLFSISEKWREVL